MFCQLLSINPSIVVEPGAQRATKLFAEHGLVPADSAGFEQEVE